MIFLGTVLINFFFWFSDLVIQLSLIQLHYIYNVNIYEKLIQPEIHKIYKVIEKRDKTAGVLYI